MKQRLLFFAVGIASSMVTPEAFGQTVYAPAARQGYYLSLNSLSGAFMTQVEDIGGLGFMQGGTFGFRAGQMATDEFGFGISITTGGGANDTWTSGYGALSLEGQYVPLKGENLSFFGGIGIAGLGVQRAEESEQLKSDPEGSVGTRYALGMSYDWFPFYDPGDGSGGFAVTPYFETSLVIGDGIWGAAIGMGVGISYWFGWEDNRLKPELPTLAR